MSNFYPPKNHPLNRPLIGILPDFQEGSASGYSIKNHYAIRQSYVDAINDSGGLAVLLTYNYSAIEEFLTMIDGLMVVGGNMDISPARYGENSIHPAVKLNLTRENFEYEIVSKALQNKTLPIFGICNGMQLISVLHGGKIIQHIPDNPQFIDHEQSHFAEFKDYHKPYHEVFVEKNSQFFDIIKTEKLATNSSHHQGLIDVGAGLKIVGKTADGIIEAFEKPSHPFCMAVQWHPEYLTSIAEKQLFEEFIKHSLIYKNNKNDNAKNH